MNIKAQTKSINNLRSFFIMKLFIAFFVFMSTSCVEEKEAGYPQSAKENYLNKKYLVAVLDTIWKTEQEMIRKQKRSTSGLSMTRLALIKEDLILSGI